MSLTGQLILDTAEKICASEVTQEQLDLVAEGGWPAELWRALTESGLAFATEQGTDLPLADAYAPLMVVGRHVAPVPLAESLVAGQLLEQADMPMEHRPYSLAFFDQDQLKIKGGKLSGQVDKVPFGRFAERLILVGPDDQHWLVSKLDQAALSLHFNIAGEPRDSFLFSGTEARPLLDQSSDQSRVLLALTRVLMMAGATESALKMSVQYALDRVQFGKPIAKFQAIQQQLAAAAGEAAAALQAAQNALSALGSELLVTEVAVAKSRVGEAASLVSEIAHQVHGAIGFTYEHSLHYRVKRLWAWRDELGHEAEWQERLGRAVIARGADQLWQFIVAPGSI